MSARKFVCRALFLVPVLLFGCGSTGSGGEMEYRKVLPTIAFEMLHDSPLLPILDVRTPGEFKGERGHLANARNISYEELRDRLGELDWLKGRTFLVYCSGPDDVRGRQAVLLLRASGWPDAVLMDGGIEAWLEDGFGTVIDNEE